MNCPTTAPQAPSTDLNAAVGDIFKVLAAENWARFYFAVDRDGQVFVDIPAERILAAEKNQPLLAEFLKEINAKPTDYETSQRVVGEFVFRNLEVSRYASGILAQAFDSEAFKLENRLFAMWLTSHEAIMDERVRELDEWFEYYEGWRESEQVRRFAAGLAGSGNVENPGQGGVH
ncbi:hypothetical protein G3N56_03300 [Desulfovibrio sulfodismutans]|uniref:Uncharacterized protein n=1 Tax=Desulfolutivibrio sulfodismutans TaxID=63561 RepID=A0A7K3NHV2_9BACT|nr:hypothetical protein [Desulfolutivibrio sulfodismutans]NDY55768.1 hypothetical protein [Desulfolutivibrio sulfodismutans]QLA13386.1 hypothetical protein GD606_14505 [Desulfolutivibrio sulfodismutans DSM 3696]